MSEAPEASRSARPLRASYIWDGTVLADVLLRRGRAITLGPDRTPTFLTPDLDLPPRFPILKRSRRKCSLSLVPGMAGVMSIAGERLEVADFLATPEPGATPGSTRRVDVGPGDWGVIHLDGRGDHILFFHFAERERRLGAGSLRDTELLWPALAFTVVFFALLVSATMPFQGDRHSYLFPGNRELIADYLVNRPEPRPVVQAQAATQAGDEDGEIDTPAPTAGDPGQASGAGERERARQHPTPRPERTPPDRQLPEELQRGLGTQESRRQMTRAADAEQLDERLDDVMASLDARAGDRGRGEGRGTGVGEGGAPGTGTSTRGGGPGGGGRAHGDAVTRGDLDTGETRQARGTATGEGTEEVQVRVRTGQPRGNLGGLTAEEINRVVRSRQNRIRACYERQLRRHPDLSGRVVMQWRIGPGGQVTTARVRETTVRHGPVEDCIVRTVQSMEFPSPRGGATALVNSYPFIFAPR